MSTDVDEDVETEHPLQELHRRIDELETEVERLRKNYVSESTLNLLLDAIAGEELEIQDDTDADPVELREELIQVAAKRAETRTDARRALSIAGQLDTGERADGGPSKTRRAMILSRDEAVYRATSGAGGGGSVTASEVINMARSDDVDLDHRLVFDAWGKLTEEWPELRYEQRDDLPNRLAVDAEDLSEDLVDVVEMSLSRDDLAERLNSPGN